MTTLIKLSERAIDLLKRNMTDSHIEVDNETRDAYRELARAGLMMPLHTPLGRESAYRMTQEGVDLGRSIVGKC